MQYRTYTIFEFYALIGMFDMCKGSDYVVLTAEWKEDRQIGRGTLVYGNYVTTFLSKYPSLERSDFSMLLKN